MPGSAYSANPELARDLRLLGMPSMGATGSQLLDLSPYKNHGSLENMDPATDWVPGGPQGRMALEFDGNEQYVLMQPISASSTRVFTYVCWTVINGSGNYHCMGEGNTGDATPTTRLGTSSGKAFIVRRTDSNILVSVTSSVNIDDGELHCIACTGDGSILRLFVDGVEDGTPVSISDISTPTNFSIGSGVKTSITSSLVGSVSLSAVWSRPLALSKIRHMYEDSDALVRRRAKVFAIGAVTGRLLVHPGWTGGMQQMVGGMRG